MNFGFWILDFGRLHQGRILTNPKSKIQNLKSFRLLILAFVFILHPSSFSLPDYPDDAYSRPPADRWHCFETATGITLPGNTLQRAALWNRNELISVEGKNGRTTQWRFNRKRGVTDVPNLGFMETIRRAPDSISFHVRNRSPRPVQFTGVLYEYSWNRSQADQYTYWAMPSKTEIAPGGESDISFSVMDASGPHNERKPWFPARLTIIIANPIEDEIEYDLTLSNLVVHYPCAPKVNVSAITAPEKAGVSEECRFSIAASGIKAGAVVDLEVRDEPWVLWRIRLTPEEKGSLANQGPVSIERPLPWYLPPRELSVGLVVNGYRAKGAEARIKIASNHTPRLPKMDRRVHNGRETIFANGKPITWSGYASYDYQPGNVGEFGASGADMFVVATDAGRHVHQIAAPTWTDWDITDNNRNIVAQASCLHSYECFGPHGCRQDACATIHKFYDFGELDERVAMGLQANPDALITLRVSLALPPFWLEDHKDSLALVRTDTGDFPWEETGCPAVSLASEDWRAQQAACLRRLLDHCKKQPWASRLAAVILGGEVTEEWFAWGANDGQYADYSPVNQQAFAAWCKDKKLPFTSIPSPAERKLAGYDVYPPDAAGKASAAYADYCSEKTAETIEYFAKAVKDETKRRTLVSVFYGYIIQLAGEPRQHLSGHFAIGRLLGSRDVDCILGIPLHNFRNLTQGYDLYTSATESIFSHGKLYVNENDLFSWLHNSLWYTEYDPANPRAGAIRMHQREAADDMVHGVPRQWFSLLANWHHDDELQKEFARQIALNRASPAYDRTPVEEVAFVVDDTSFAAMPPASQLPRITHADFLFALGRTGAPVGIWLLSDLDRLPDRIRVVVIADAAAAKARDLDKLRKLIERGKRTIVINGPAGLVNPETWEWDGAAIRELTGLPITIENTALPGIATLTADGREVSHVAALRPRAFMDGPGWLRYSDGKTAGGERPLANGGRLIWCGVPPLDSALCRAWFEAAGVHCYAPIGFTVHASAQLVAITAPVAGDALVRWPRAVSAKDLYDGWSGIGEEMTCPFEAGQTRLFSLVLSQR